MHKRVFEEFEKICAPKNITGSVLEVGATPDPSSLLNMKSLQGAHKKIGINLDGPSEYANFKILKGNANDMSCFADNTFDAVVCNAVFEHDKFFWLTLSEIKRVTKSGGWVFIGAPGFGQSGGERRLRFILHHIPWFGRYVSEMFFTSATVTLLEHNYPGDYYRFNRQAFEQVFFEGMNEVVINSILLPPRIIGAGKKP